MPEITQSSIMSDVTLPSTTLRSTPFIFRTEPLPFGAEVARSGASMGLISVMPTHESVEKRAVKNNVRSQTR